MKKKGLTNQKWFSAVFWLVILVVVWELGAFIVAGTKRTPENILH